MLSTVVHSLVIESGTEPFWHLYMKIPMSSFIKFRTESTPNCPRSLWWSASSYFTLAIDLAVLFCKAWSLSLIVSLHCPDTMLQYLTYVDHQERTFFEKFTGSFQNTNTTPDLCRDILYMVTPCQGITYY